MKTEVIQSNSRGHLNFGWLDTYHTFSFGEYHNPNRMNFGALRVVNDDLIEPNSMFPTHPHNNMEIITVVLEGCVEHQDNIGNKTTIRAGEIQVMSAGTGILHSEANPSATQELSLFQLWIYPKERDIEPYYSQRNFSNQLRIQDVWHELVAPHEQNGQLKINQDAYISLGAFSKANNQYNYRLNSITNGVFIMVIDGILNINNEKLGKRDAIMIHETDIVDFTVDGTTHLIVIEVPLLFEK